MKNFSFTPSKFSILFISLFIILSTFFLGTYVGQSQASTKNSDADLTLFWKVWGILDDKYVSHSTSTPGKFGVFLMTNMFLTAQVLQL